MQEKKQLRREIKERLKNADPQELAETDAFICGRVLARPEVREAKCIMSFFGCGTELNTHILNQGLLAAGKKLCLPLTFGEGRMEARVVTDLEDMIPGAFGIPAPSPTAEQVSPDEIDLVILPGMAFDANRQRLGRGGGYYDRFLKLYDGPTLAPTRELQMVEDIPCEPWDAKADVVITESRVFTGK